MKVLHEHPLKKQYVRGTSRVPHMYAIAKENQPMPVTVILLCYAMLRAMNMA